MFHTHSKVKTEKKGLKSSKMEEITSSKIQDQ